MLMSELGDIVYWLADMKSCLGDTKVLIRNSVILCAN